MSAIPQKKPSSESRSTLKPSPKPPITSEQVKPEWLDDVRAASARDDYEFRPSPKQPSIEVRLRTSPQWLYLMLPGSGILFTDNAERNAVLRKLQAP